MDYRLKSLLDGMAIFRLMQNAKTIKKTIETGKVEKITIGDIRLRDSRRGRKIDLLFMIKGTDTHQHFFENNNSIGMVTTLQVSPNRSKKEHIPVDTNNFFNTLGEEIKNFFHDLQKLDMSLRNYDVIQTTTYLPKINKWTLKKNGKEIIIDVDYRENHAKISELSLDENRLGIIEEGSDMKLIIIRDGSILSCEIDILDKICSKIEPILSANGVTKK